MRHERNTFDEKELETTSEVIEEVEEAIDETIEDVEKELVEEDEVEGIVVNCDRLNVRKTPDNGDNVIGQIMTNRKVKVDKSKSTDKYYKVLTETKLDGYCAKEYIKLCE